MRTMYEVKIYKNFQVLQPIFSDYYILTEEQNEKGI